MCKEHICIINFSRQCALISKVEKRLSNNISEQWEDKEEDRTENRFTKVGSMDVKLSVVSRYKWFYTVIPIVETRDGRVDFYFWYDVCDLIANALYKIANHWECFLYGE